MAVTVGAVAITAAASVPTPTVVLSVVIRPAAITAAGTIPVPALSSPLVIRAVGWSVPAATRYASVRIGTAPAVPPPAALVVTLDGLDVTAILARGIAWDASLGGDPSATLTLDDLDGIVPWPPHPGFVAWEPTGPLPELVIAVADGPALFRGPVLSWDRTWVAAGAWRYGIRAQGWQRNMSTSPVYPLPWFWDTVVEPDGGTSVVGYERTIAGDGVAGKIVRALADCWTGPPLGTDGPYSMSPGASRWRPRGAAMSDVMDRLLPGMAWWVGADMVLHWRPVITSGLSSYAGDYAATWEIGDRPGSGVVVPTSVRETADGLDMREGVFVNGTLPDTDETLGGGPPLAGWERTSGSPEQGTWAGGDVMRGRTALKRGMTVTLPPQPGDGVIPTLGEVVHVDWEDIDPGWWTIRAVHASAVVTGEGVGDIEWTLELGDTERRSFAREVGEPDEPSDKWGKGTDTVIKMEPQPVDATMGVDSVQNVQAIPINTKRERVRLISGSVEWHVWVDGSDVGAGDTATGWWLTAQTTPIVWESADTGREWGFAYCELHCGANSSTSQGVRVEAVLIPA